MPYSQKYCLVSFIESIDVGTTFNMADWPLHVTLADVFAIDLAGTTIKTKLADYLANQPVVKTSAIKEATLGAVDVTLLDKTNELLTLHRYLIDLLEEHGATFNTPEFAGEGFVPHCTVQKTGQLHVGDVVTMCEISLVDMFPGGNWQQREVINTFTLQATP